MAENDSIRAIGSFLLLIILVQPVKGEVIIPFIPADQLSVEAKARVEKDPKTGMYTYRYFVTNHPSSKQNLSNFAVELAYGTQVFHAESPRGWVFGVQQDLPIARWTAVEIGELPADYIDDGNILPSPYNVKPGKSLGGFSFQTFAPPGKGKFYAQGFTKLPHVTSDEDIDENMMKPFTENSYSSFTESPILPTDSKRRRPAVEGFLFFPDLKRVGHVFALPVKILVKFAAAGESVDRSTFRATLNQRDVTDLFVPDTANAESLVGIFTFNNSPLIHGGNVLLLTVKGIDPETNRTAADIDRVNFEIRK